MAPALLAPQPATRTRSTLQPSIHPPTLTTYSHPNTSNHPRRSVDIVEFVSGEHTPRNLLIRAVRLRTPPPAAAWRRMWGEYAALKAELGVTPHLEKLLAAQLPEAAAAAAAAGGGGDRAGPDRAARRQE